MISPQACKHALIIEDEMLIALEVESLLHDLGFESCDIVDNPRDAVKSALARKPDLMTADIRIVGGTGIEAVAAITDQLGPIPHVYVTGNADMLTGKTAAPVVDKPLTRRALADACQRACAA
jgi:CheY-like chemotaxis protein